MKIFAISDLHLSFGANKPMEVFGGQWENYLPKIVADWQQKVADDDVVLIAGDISWAMKLEQTAEDFAFLQALPGKKIITRGNHDFWWSSISAVRAVLPDGIFALQNDAILLGNTIFCGTRGWAVPENGVFETAQDEKIFRREVIRLELCLESAKRLQTNNQDIVVMIHFPPVNSVRDDSEFSELFERFGVQKVVYGHLHGKKARADLMFEKNGVQYFLTSCDQLSNELALIAQD